MTSYRKARDDTATAWAITTVAETGSTNADLAAAAASGAAHGTVLVADVQRRGRGRLGRSWVAPPGTALLFSVLLRLDEVPVARRGWVGAVLGLAVVDALTDVAKVPADLKWPNDVLIDGRKVAGILAELTGDAVVVGVGINVSVPAEQLPRADATSIALAGGESCDRAELLESILDRLDILVSRWRAASGDVDVSGLRAEYLRRCGTVGARVRVQLPDGSAACGTAIDVAPDGSVVVDDGHGPRRFAAGDVQHLRNEPVPKD